MSEQLQLGRPTLVDNLDTGWTHGEALRVLLGRAPGAELAVATGYVSLSGLVELADAAEEGRPVRVLVGATSAPPADHSAVRFRVREAFQALDGALARERDHDNFPPARRAQLERVRGFLAREGVQVRRYLPRFLHGKIFVVGEEMTLCGSANLTGGGLFANLELGIVDYNPGPNGLARAWFEARWAEETEDLTDRLLDLLAPPPQDVRPYDMFLRALDEFFGSEPVEEAPSDSRLRLAAFQRDGYARAAAIAQRYGGVLYADGTGLGKTFIGLRFVEDAVDRRREPALAVVPAQLKRSFWGAAPVVHQLPFQVITHDELALDHQLGDGQADHLALPKDHYRLVVVDEAQAFRNPQTGRHRALLRLLGGSPKRVVLLSATPVNNSLWDLYHLISLWAESDNAFAEQPLSIPSLERFFVRCGANDPDQLSPARLFGLLSRIAVGRPRSFVERFYPDDEIAGVPVRFPKPEYQTRRYRLDDAYSGLLATIVDILERLRFARYQPARYLRPEAVRTLPPEEQRAALAAAARERSLAGLLLSGLLKRFESSADAARQTVENLIATHERFLAALDAGFVPRPDELELLADGDDGTLAGVLAGLAGVSEQPVDRFRPELREHVEADLVLLRELRGQVGEPDPANDPKVAALAEVLEAAGPEEKVVVFASFADTVVYLARALEQTALGAGREAVVIAGRDTTPEGRVRAVACFAPRTAPFGATGLPPGEGEVDLLISTDVLSEGQNLQQAAVLVNFDLTWNPQRMVQRNGRINRLGGQPRITLCTLAPQDAELERLLRLEARIRDKVRAANAALGMEARILDIDPEERVFGELEPFGAGDGTSPSEDDVSREVRAEAGGGRDLDVEIEEAAGAAAERYRLELKRAREEGDLERVRRLPFGVGTCFTQGAGVPSRGAPGVFFAARVRDERAWRYVTAGPAPEVRRDELPMLQAIESARASRPEDHELERVLSAWEIAEADIRREWNEEDVDEPTIPPAQAWALDLLTRVPLPGDAQRAAAASLRVARRQSIVRALVAVRRSLESDDIDERQAAGRVAELVADFGLRPVEPVEADRESIEPADIEVVCYCVVKGPGGS